MQLIKEGLHFALQYACELATGVSRLFDKKDCFNSWVSEAATVWIEINVTRVKILMTKGFISTSFLNLITL